MLHHLFMMPMAASISEGILLGTIAFVGINVMARKWQNLNITIVILAIIFIVRYLMPLFFSIE